jgi:two-component system OmpR family sensor kinase
MRSLRARLIAVVLLVAAAGLVALASVTYLTQRSYLYDRVDQQARSAIPAISHQLAEQNGGAGRFGGGGGGPRVQLPPETYGELRDAAGRRIGDAISVSFDQRVHATPKLPASLPLNKIVTVPAATSDGPSFRVLSVPDLDDAGTTVIAVPLTEATSTLNRLLLVLGSVIAGVLVLLGAAVFSIVRLGLRPLDRIGRTADAIAGGDLALRVAPAEPRTEVGRLGLALNNMLGRLERAFAERQASEDKLRQFLSDASHELRTPLASIRGYAELYRMGAASDPEQTERAMGRIEAEAARMGVLVEDLLLLARLDEQQDPQREFVDLAELADDAVHDTRAAAPDRAIALDADGDATVVADGHQLRQVLANLLRNALVHTPAGTPIEVRVAEVPGGVVLQVRDHGPGLPPGDPAALFERFWRAEGGRKQGRAGAGLGLAIVAGIVDAHHGTVGAENAPGGGARFTVRLPAAEVAAEDVAPEPAPAG